MLIFSVCKLLDAHVVLNIRKLYWMSCIEELHVCSLLCMVAHQSFSFFFFFKYSPPPRICCPLPHFHLTGNRRAFRWSLFFLKIVSAFSCATSEKPIDIVEPSIWLHMIFFLWCHIVCCMVEMVTFSNLTHNGLFWLCGEPLPFI